MQNQRTDLQIKGTQVDNSGVSMPKSKMRWGPVLVAGIFGLTLSVIVVPVLIRDSNSPKHTRPALTQKCEAPEGKLQSEFTAKQGDRIESKFFGPRFDVQVINIGADRIELFGLVPSGDNSSDANVTVLIKFGGSMILQTSDPGVHNVWTMSAEKGDESGTARITLSK